MRIGFSDITRDDHEERSSYGSGKLNDTTEDMEVGFKCQGGKLVLNDRTVLANCLAPILVSEVLFSVDSL